MGNYPKILSSIKNVTTGLIGAFGVIEGLRLGAEFAGDAVRLAREAKGVEFAFKRLGVEGVEAFENIKKSTRGTLSNLDIKKSLNEFKNFNISLKQTDVLFEFLAVRAAQTGKSVDSLRDSLVEGLAKESKLRIDNLGISVKDLNSELEKTPVFVDAVANIAKREITKAGSILDDAANSQEKFNAAFENFKVSIGSGAIGNFTNEMYGLGTAIALVGSEINDASDGMFEFFVNSGLVSVGLGDIVKQRAESNREEAKRIALVKEINDLQIKRGVNEDTAFNLGNKLIQQTTKEIEQMAEIERRMAAAIKLRTEEKEIIEGRNKVVSISNILTENEIKNAEGITDAQKKQFIALSKLNDLKAKGISVNPLNAEEIESDAEKIKETLDLIDKWAEEVRFDEILDDSIGRFAGTLEDFTGISGAKFKNLFDTIKDGGIESFEEIAEVAQMSFALIGSASNSFFQSKIDGYQNDIDANNEYYENILNNEALTDEEKQRLEADRETKNRELEKKKKKEQEKQAIANKAFAVADIILSTAKGIASAASSIVTLPLVPFIAGIGAAELAIALATPIPKFAEGGVMDKDGAMMINDHSSGRLEVVERDGQLLMTNKKNAIVDGKKGDIIHKDAKEYFNNLSNDDILKDVNNHAIMATLQNQNYLINKLDNKKEVDSQKQNTDRLIKAIKGQKTKFNVHQNITLADDLRLLERSNNSL